MSTDEFKSLHSKSELRLGTGINLHCLVLHAPEKIQLHEINQLSQKSCIYNINVCAGTT